MTFTQSVFRLIRFDTEYWGITSEGTRIDSDWMIHWSVCSCRMPVFTHSRIGVFYYNHKILSFRKLLTDDKINKWWHNKYGLVVS